MTRTKPIYTYRLALADDSLRVIEEVSIRSERNKEEATDYNQFLTGIFSDVVHRHAERYTEQRQINTLRSTAYH